jgi:hypothetical protein
MAISIKQKEKFIELRAQGLSFDSISEKLKISKPTLIKLQTELGGEISKLSYLMYDALIEKYKLTQMQKVEGLSKQLKKVNDELDKKDFTQLTIKELILIRDKYQSELSQLLEDCNYRTGEFIKNISNGIDLGDTEITIPLH